MFFLTLVYFFCPIRTEVIETVACFDTKCPLITEGFENIVRYKDCEPSMSRVVFCNNEQYCVHNSMTGQGMCLNNPTEPPPTTVPDSSRLTAAQRKLVLIVSMPFVFLLLIFNAIIFRCYKKGITFCWYNQVNPMQANSMAVLGSKKMEINTKSIAKL